MADSFFEGRLFLQISSAGLAVFGKMIIFAGFETVDFEKRNRCIGSRKGGGGLSCSPHALRRAFHQRHPVAIRRRGEFLHSGRHVSRFSLCSEVDKPRLASGSHS